RDAAWRVTINWRGAGRAAMAGRLGASDARKAASVIFSGGEFYDTSVSTCANSTPSCFGEAQRRDV
ncbi:MAG: hypothetical protein AAF961_18750, partial [Planctomycetota bacterium]